MPQSALSSLLPLAGAIALTVQGIRRLARSRNAEPSLPIMQPKEPVAPPARTARRAPLPDVACADCGTSIPAGTTRCAPCARAEAGPDATLRTTALHWLFLVGALAAVIGAGWFMSP
jgi:hypothetical protein